MTRSVDRARKAVTDRAELPGMSLMEHLAELRKRLIHSVYYLIVGFVDRVHLPRAALRLHLSARARASPRPAQLSPIRQTV